MVVDPAYQRQGLGTMLMKWGNTAADELGVEVSFKVNGQRIIYVLIALVRD
jgi:predicted N-acetyltransferase YhbS